MANSFQKRLLHGAWLVVLLAVGLGAQTPTISYAGPWITLDGKKLSLFRDGKPVIMDFWASWCGMCAGVVPFLNQAMLKYPHLRVVGVNMDEPGDLDNARVYVNKNKMQYLSILDQPPNLSERLDLVGLPTLVLLNAQGKELWRSLGEPESLLDSLNKYLPAQLR